YGERLGFLPVAGLPGLVLGQAPQLRLLDLLSALGRALLRIFVDLLEAVVRQQPVVPLHENRVLHVGGIEGPSSRPVDRVDHDVVVNAPGLTVDLGMHRRQAIPARDLTRHLHAELVCLLPIVGVIRVECPEAVTGERLDDVVGLHVLALDGVPRRALDGPRPVLAPTLPRVSHLLLGEFRYATIYASGRDEAFSLGLAGLLSADVLVESMAPPRRI